MKRLTTDSASRTARHNAVPLALCAIGLVTVGLPWLTHKANRLAEGDALRLWAFSGAAGPISLTLLWLTALAASLTGRGRKATTIWGLASALLLIVAPLVAGLGAGDLRAGGDGMERVSLGPGFWVAIVSAYLLVFAARRRLEDGPWRKAVITWLAPVGLTILLLTGNLSELSIMQELVSQQGRFLQEVGRHCYISGISVGLGVVIGVPLGVWASRNPTVSRVIFTITNTAQTIPALALFGLLMAPLALLTGALPSLKAIGIRSIGFTPAIVALTAYSLLPIVRNTHAGLGHIDEGVIEVGKGMGMKSWEVFLRVETPLAAPLVVSGIRTAAVQTVGNAVLAALIGAGGLGFFVFKGLGETAPDLILLGALPTIALALLTDSALRMLNTLVTPRGLQVEGR